ncbi:type II toxin-antitoxin system prevent-host-death family antitoxin [Pendulispora rubella]|uniref:Antitoxin n=1 Tax=Pendulispora rubella TaxID=2741070 RepID=A0ABZ2LEW0_9BACT
MNINVYAAKTQLSSLLDKAAEGEEIVITRNGRPVAKLVPANAPTKRRVLGRLKGRIRIRKDFDAPLPDDVLDAFERK